MFRPKEKDTTAPAAKLLGREEGQMEQKQWGWRKMGKRRLRKTDVSAFCPQNPARSVSFLAQRERTEKEQQSENKYLEEKSDFSNV